MRAFLAALLLCLSRSFRKRQQPTDDTAGHYDEWTGEQTRRLSCVLVGAVLLCLCVPAQAKPSVQPYTFDGDRYVRVAQSANDVTRAIRCPPPACQRGTVSKSRVKRPKAAPVRNKLAPPSLSLAGGIKREVLYAIGVPSHFVRGRLICAANVGSALAERGIKGTGSRLAKSYLAWGRASHAVPGAVAVFNRGRNARSGHVMIVDHVRPNGQVIYLNPSARRQAWVVGPYSRRPIAFRVAG